MPCDQPPDWEFSERDLLVLRELAADPQLSSRDIAANLEAKHDVCVSHVTVSESIRKMRDEGVFRDAIVPDETYFDFSLFEFELDPSNYGEKGRAAKEAVRSDRHTVFYCFSDGEYQWLSVMMFPDSQAESQWIREFYEDHGDVVRNVSNTVVHDVSMFRRDPAVFTELRE